MNNKVMDKGEILHPHDFYKTQGERGLKFHFYHMLLNLPPIGSFLNVNKFHKKHGIRGRWRRDFNTYHLLKFIDS